MPKHPTEEGQHGNPLAERKCGAGQPFRALVERHHQPRDGHPLEGLHGLLADLDAAVTSVVARAVVAEPSTGRLYVVADLRLERLDGLKGPLIADLVLEGHR